MRRDEMIRKDIYAMLFAAGKDVFLHLHWQQSWRLPFVRFKAVLSSIRIFTGKRADRNGSIVAQSQKVIRGNLQFLRDQGKLLYIRRAPSGTITADRRGRYKKRVRQLKTLDIPDEHDLLQTVSKELIFLFFFCNYIIASGLFSSLIG